MMLGLLAAAIVLLFLLTSPKKPAKTAPADPAPAPFPGWQMLQQMQAPPAPQPTYRTNREAELAEDADLVRSHFLDSAIAEQRAAALARMAAYMPAASLPTPKPKTPAPVQAP